MLHFKIGMLRNTRLAHAIAPRDDTVFGHITYSCVLYAIATYLSAHLFEMGHNRNEWHNSVTAQAILGALINITLYYVARLHHVSMLYMRAEIAYEFCPLHPHIYFFRLLLLLLFLCVFFVVFCYLISVKCNARRKKIVAKTIAYCLSARTALALSVN